MTDEDVADDQEEEKDEIDEEQPEVPVEDKGNDVTPAEAEEEDEFIELVQRYWNLLIDTEVFELQGTTVYLWHLVAAGLVLLLIVILACCVCCLCRKAKKADAAAKN